MKVFMNRRALPEHEQDEAQEIATRYADQQAQVTAHTASTDDLAALFPASADLIRRGELHVEITAQDVQNAAHNDANIARAANNTDDEPSDDLSEDFLEDQS